MMTWSGTRTLALGLALIVVTNTVALIGLPTTAAASKAHFT